MTGVENLLESSEGWRWVDTGRCACAFGIGVDVFSTLVAVVEDLAGSADTGRVVVAGFPASEASRRFLNSVTAGPIVAAEGMMICLRCSSFVFLLESSLMICFTADRRAGTRATVGSLRKAALSKQFAQQGLPYRSTCGFFDRSAAQYKQASMKQSLERQMISMMGLAMKTYSRLHAITCLYVE